MNRIKQLYLRLLDVVLDWGTEIIAILLLVIGLIGYFRGANPYVPIFTEVIGIGLAVLLIDLSNKMLTTRNEKKRLILQMGSPDNAFACEAARQLRARSWLKDGSLRRVFLARANLEGVNLREAKLQEANLKGAILIGAHLEHAKLREVHLEHAKLRKAHLFDANLEGAYLWDAKLEGADLSCTNLEEADLLGAKLQKANLWKANLEGANLGGANLKGANVTQAQLDKALSLDGATMPDGTVYNPETFKESLEGQEPPE